MSDQFEELERILGGKLERADARTVPGTDGVATREAIYFSDDGRNKLKKQFKNITCFTESPNATCGGINEAGCDITPPGGPFFMQPYITVILLVGERTWRRAARGLDYSLLE